MAKPEKVFTMSAVVDLVEKGERVFIHITQFANFMAESEILALPFCIKSTVAGDQVILERWDIGGDSWSDFGGGEREDSLDLY